MAGDRVHRQVRALDVEAAQHQVHRQRRLQLAAHQHVGDDLHQALLALGGVEEHHVVLLLFPAVGLAVAVHVQRHVHDRLVVRDGARGGAEGVHLVGLGVHQQADQRLVGVLRRFGRIAYPPQVPAVHLAAVDQPVDDRALGQVAAVHGAVVDGVLVGDKRLQIISLPGLDQPVAGDLVQVQLEVGIGGQHQQAV